MHADHKSIGFLQQIMSPASSDSLSVIAGLYNARVSMVTAKAEEQRWEFVDLSTQRDCGEKLQMENTV